MGYNATSWSIVELCAPAKMDRRSDVRVASSGIVMFTKLAMKRPSSELPPSRIGTLATSPASISLLAARRMKSPSMTGAQVAFTLSSYG